MAERIVINTSSLIALSRMDASTHQSATSGVHRVARAKTLGIVQTIRRLIEKVMQEGIHYRPDLVSQVLTWRIAADSLAGV
jgi:hypothetical protein